MKNILIIATVLLVAACGNEKEKTLPASPAIPVTVALAGGENTAGGFSSSGTVEAASSAMLSTRIMGYVTNVNVKTGQKVNAGQLLLRINDSDLNAKKAQAVAGVSQAQAAYKNAKRDFDRFTVLFSQQSASQKELEDMTTRFESASAALDGAREVLKEINAQFRYTAITAPFTGVITATFVKEGNMASPGQPLLHIEAGDRLRVETLLGERAISLVKKDMPVTVTIKSSGTRIAGRVSEVSSAANNATGQYAVKIDLDKPDKQVLSGMYASVYFEGSGTPGQGRDEAVLLPEAALIRSGGLSGVYTIGENNTALLRWVRTGRNSGNEVEVLSGLSAGEQYIVSAEGRLFNGAKVISKQAQ